MRYRTKRVLIPLALILLAATFSCGRKPADQAATARPIKATLQTVAVSDIGDVFEVSGTIRSRTTSIVSSRMMGAVLAVHVREGDSVRAGQPLIEIDSRDLMAQLQRTQAGLREAENGLEEVQRNIRAAESAKEAAEANQTLAASTLRRYAALFDKRSVSPQEFEQIRAKSQIADAEAERASRMLSSLNARKNQAIARIDQAKAEVTGAQVYAAYARISSAGAGLVIARHTEVGSMAVPGAPLLTIEDDSQYRLETAVGESQVRNIHIGDEVEIRIDSIGVPIAGRVREIIPTADSASRTQTVKIDLPAGSQIRSGTYGRARFQFGSRHAITIPPQAIVSLGQLTYVFVTDDSGIARLRLIKAGKQAGDKIEVLSGLTGGERVIVDPPRGLIDGSRIESL